MNLYNDLAWFVVASAFSSVLYMIFSAWRSRHDLVLTIGFVLMAFIDFALGWVYILVSLQTIPSVTTLITAGYYVRPILPALLLLPCALLELKRP